MIIKKMDLKINEMKKMPAMKKIPDNIQILKKIVQEMNIKIIKILMKMKKKNHSKIKNKILSMNMIIMKMKIIEMKLTFSIIRL
jgi:hypothetical protein